MNRDEAARRIAFLSGEINRHNYLYFVENRPELSDAGYDRLVAELRDLEQSFPDLAAEDSPLRRVGERPAEGFATAGHDRPMLSIDNGTTEEEVAAFDRRLARILGATGEIEYVAEPKIDGLAVSLVYREGTLRRAVTRGDGLRGDLVTANARAVRAIPLSVEYRGRLEVRGEVYLAREEFERINARRRESGEALFANPRNAAAGSLKQLDPAVTAGRRLLFCAWAGYPETPVEEHWKTLAFLRGLRIPVSPHARLVRGVAGALEYCREWDSRRLELPYEIDGVVIKANRLADQEKAGYTGRAPRWALAFKFPPRQETTRVREILVQVGRTGTLTPVAVLDPVTVSGSRVGRATLHNEAEVGRLDLRVGDTVFVEKAGEVIPRVVKVVREARTGSERPFRMPGLCPACGSPVHREPGEAAVRCLNLACPPQVIERILHFAGRAALDIEGLGPETLSALVARGLVSDPADLYRLRREDLEPLEGMAEKSAGNLLDAIGRSRRTTLERFILGLGIRHVGADVSRRLAGALGSLEKLAGAAGDELVSIDGVGPVVAREVRAFFARPENRRLVERLAGEIEFEAAGAAGRLPAGELAGKVFVFTGTLAGLERERAAGLVRERGGRVSAAVSARTDYLVAGRSPGSKVGQARRLGVRVLSEAEFFALVGEAPAGSAGGGLFPGGP